jgi:2-C-methyl-D-erythritol 4-phosphate cytidylyltransferase
MDVFQQLNAMGAQIVANRAILVSDGVRVVVAQMVDDKMVLTPEGEEAAAKAAPAPKAKAEKSKPTKAAAEPKPEE